MMPYGNANWFRSWLVACWNRAILWTRANLFLIRPTGSSFSKIWILIVFHNKKNAFGNATCTMSTILSRPRYVKSSTIPTYVDWCPGLPTVGIYSPETAVRMLSPAPRLLYRASVPRYRTLPLTAHVGTGASATSASLLSPASGSWKVGPGRHECPQPGLGSWESLVMQFLRTFNMIHFFCRCAIENFPVNGIHNLGCPRAVKFDLIPTSVYLRTWIGPELPGRHGSMKDITRH